MPRILLYARASTHGQLQSIPEQYDYLLEWFQGHLLRRPDEGWIIDTLYHDPATSGGKRFMNRTGGEALWTNIRSGDWMVATHMDRAFRDAVDCWMTLEKLEERGCQLLLLNISQDITADTTTPAGRLLLQQMAIFSQYERSIIRDRTTRSLAWKKKHLCPVGEPTIGYSALNGCGVDGRLVVNEAQRALCYRIIDLKAAKWTVKDILAQIQSEGVQVKRRAMMYWSRRCRDHFPLYGGKGLAGRIDKLRPDFDPADWLTVDRLPTARELLSKGPLG